ncbi:IS4 family transposase, partial [Candidatus Saccharibacteria bacterium]|nr:IS4 family transposase [Candidatus Saccharibacteria bacterium]
MRISEIVHPATLAQVGHFQALGLRARVLTLPVMMALVLSLLWQQTGSVNELVRLIHQECILWVPPL